LIDTHLDYFGDNFVSFTAVIDTHLDYFGDNFVSVQFYSSDRYTSLQVAQVKTNQVMDLEDHQQEVRRKVRILL
jgi:hypothetical protein